MKYTSYILIGPVGEISTDMEYMGKWTDAVWMKNINGGCIDCCITLYDKRLPYIRFNQINTIFPYAINSMIERHQDGSYGKYIDKR